MPASELVLHDVLFDEAAGYRPRHGTVGGDVARGRDIGLWLTVDGGALRVERLPGRAVHPRTSAMAGLFALLPGQIGRWRANFRFSLREHGWFYEDWLIHVSNGPVRDGACGRADYEVDHRVHLYGGPVRTGRRGARK